MIEAVVATADARGWAWTVDNVDERDWHFATVSVSRESGKLVTGLCDISVDNRVRVSVTETSFYQYGLSELQDGISSAVNRLPWVKESEKDSQPTAPSAVPAAAESVERLLRRFHLVARQLCRRYDDRPTLIVEDEYDVQDLLHALLKAEFDDIRPEELAPSRAGAASRMDFLLKSERIVIETKMAGPKLRDKSIGEQLIIDIERYQSHPSCDRLICLVYDPDGHVRNPAGLENDLSGRRGRLDVKVIVVAS